MKVDIRDAEALSALSLSALRAYLHVRAWHEGEQGWPRHDLHEGSVRSELGGACSPQDSIGRYAAGMAEAIATMAVVEDRSQLDVFADLKGAGADTRPPVSRQ